MYQKGTNMDKMKMKLSKLATKIKTKKAQIITSLVTMFTLTQAQISAYAVDYSGVSENSIIGGVLGLLNKYAITLGVVFVGIGVILIGTSIKDEGSLKRAEGIGFIIAGAILVGYKLLMGTFGIQM